MRIYLGEKNTRKYIRYTEMVTIDRCQGHATLTNTR